MNTLDALDAKSLRSDIPDFRPGDTLKVHVRVIEARGPGSRSSRRGQSAAGRRHPRDLHGPQISYGVGVERTFPLHSPNIAKVEVARRGDVRRAKLYYLRELRGKAAKIKEKRETAPTS